MGSSRNILQTPAFRQMAPQLTESQADPTSRACRKLTHSFDPLGPGGGIGRRTSFRCWRSQGRGGSSPLLGTTLWPGMLNEPSPDLEIPAGRRTRGRVRGSLFKLGRLGATVPPCAGLRGNDPASAARPEWLVADH